MGKNIKIELLKLGITQRELADFLGFNESYISLLISGKRKNKTFGEVIELDDVQAKKLAHILVPVKESTNKDKTPATKTETKTKTKTKEDETKKDESENGGNE